MPRPYGEPVEIVTAPIPAQSPFIPIEAKIVVGAVGPTSPDPIPILLLLGWGPECVSGGIRTLTRFTGGSSGGRPLSTPPPTTARTGEQQDVRTNEARLSVATGRISA